MMYINTYALITIMFCPFFVGGQQSTHRVLNVLHNSEHPASTFALLEVPVLSAPGNLNLPPGSGVKTVSLVADNLFDLLVHKMSHVYTSKKIKIESKGPRFELGDFVVSHMYTKQVLKSFIAIPQYLQILRLMFSIG